MLLSNFSAFLLFFLKMENYLVLYWHKPSGISPTCALVVAFMQLHGVSKCKKYLKHVNISYEAFGKFSYFLEYFSIFRKPKSIYLRYLKMFLETLIMFFELIRCQNTYKIFFWNFWKHL
jgi:hypothetical protein